MAENKTKIFCKICSKSCVRTSTLEKHLSQVHLREWPDLKCSICGNVFGLKADLDRHTYRVHLGKKSHECDICKKTFAHSGHLTRHKASGEKKLIVVFWPINDSKGGTET